MAQLVLMLSSSKFGTSSIKLLPTKHTIKYTHYVKCITKNVTESSCDQAMAIATPRRLANYHPSIWDNDFFQSLPSQYTEESYARRASDLKEEVREIVDKEEEPLIKLEIIDTLQRLGISYHLEHEIKNILECIYKDKNRNERWNKEENLSAIALEFRILRQHGYSVPQEVFSKFMNEDGNFKLSPCDDTKGILNLYEASFLSTRGENILDKARYFTTEILKEHLKNINVRNNEYMSTLDLLVDHALELPLHWRMLRLEAWWFINVYERKSDMNVALLEFAKLDFNIVQESHREDLKYTSRWWKNTCLGEKLNFARDRLIENFFWTIGVIFEPQYGYCRRMSTKVNALITAIDDIYDVYGTLPELELFTNAVEKWDISAVDELPDYMKICFLALYNSVNEMAYDTLTRKGIYAKSYHSKPWGDLCKSYLVEARWYYSGYTPTLEEYLQNAWISISAPTILVGAYFLTSNSFTTDSIETVKEYPNIIKWSSMILRLANDLGTSPYELKRGDNPKSIQCYMHETGASEEEAREHIKYLISQTWKKINEEVRHHQQDSNSPFEEVFIRIAMNLARMAQCMYQHGDGHGIEDMETKDRVLALIINPIN